MLWLTIELYKHQNRNIITKWNNLFMRCNPDLQNPYDCEEQTQIQAFIPEQRVQRP